ncbi:Translocon at the outer envelope membrane of chloroplast [Corchorus capsularis]|uniref:Translocon at the outer envelope membrane of chloroplast n=1 Tax=Corchorus capsularis TaxID=210143 RepID=A0A1R3HVU0_COCAP|nr:Translocon at the outer envelope membrane of chloroplast [Corchorus capsularis]
MENGVGVVDDSIIIDNTVLEEKVVNEKAEERVVGGSDEAKDVEDEVFEEAIGTQEQLPEQTENSGVEDSSVVADANGHDETIDNVGSVEVQGNLNLETEAETFEEAVGVPSGVEPLEDVVPAEEDVAVPVDEQKVEEPSSGESVGGIVVSDKIDEGGTETGTGTDELNGGNEVPENGGSGEAKVLSDEDEGNAKSDTVVEKPVNGDADKVYLEGTLADQELEALEGDNVDVEMESKLEVLPQEVNGEESRENELAADYQDKKVEESADTSSGVTARRQEDEVEALNDKLEVLPQEVNGEELRENALAADYQDKKVEESADTSSGVTTRLQEDEVEALNDKSANVDTGDQGKESSEVKVTTADLNSVDEGEQQSKTLAAVETEGNSYGEVKDLSDAQDIEYNAVIHEPKAMFSELSTSVEGTVAPENGNLSSVETFADDRSEKVEAGKTDLGTEVHDSSQPELPKEMVDAVRDIHPVTEEPEKKLEKDQVDKQSTQVTVRDIHSVTEEAEKKVENEQVDKQSNQVTLEHGVQPASGSSLSAKAEESEKKANTDQELKQKTPVIRERESLPALVPSSSIKSTNTANPPSRPAGLGRAAPLLEPAPRVVQQPRVNGTVSQAQAQQIEDTTNGEAEESDETREKLQLIRVKFLRLAHRLGQTPHNVVVAQVLYRLGLAEQLRGRNGGRVGAFSFDRASAMAEQLEAAGNEPLDFSCTIMVLGKTGVGKSATINSIFDEIKFGTDAFQTGTKKVQDVMGTVHGIRVRVIDTPGLLPSWSDQRQNEKILHSVKRFIKKTPPDIVLYLDRLDMQSRDFGDMPLLRTITEIFGPSIWFNAIVVLTHAASAPPDGPNGTASSYDMFVTQRSHVVQQAIRQAAGDMRLMNPVSLVENHSACRTNRAGQRVLPNGQVWKPHLLLLSFASKILAEANTLLKLQDTPPGKPFATRTRTPPLPFLLSSLLQSRPQVKLPEEQYGDEDGVDDDLDDSSDSEDESEYDELPPFKRLTKAQLAKLSKAQKKAYFDELEYRENLFMKKQLKEEKRRRKMMKKMAAAAKDLPSEYTENAEEESSGASSVPVPMPDLALPTSFDSDNPTHRYRYLDSSNQWLVRPVLDTHGWDHDVGYEGINVERLFVAKEKVPISFSGQITKDKKDANVQMEVSSSLKHGEGKATSLGFDMQTVGKDLAYTLRSETRFSNFRKNKATAGISVTLLGDSLSAGMKVEDKLIANKRLQVVMTGGAMTGRGDLAYGGSLEAQLRDKDYPLGRSLSTLGLSVMDWHGDLAIGCNVQSQVPVGRSTNLVARANLNNRGAGQVSIRINSSEQIQIALVALLPLLKKLLEFPQQMQYGQ